MTGLVSFSASDGQHYSFTVRDTPLVKGTRVAVIYPSVEPRDARLDPGYRVWLRTAFAAAAALAMIVLGGYAAWYARQWAQQRPR